MVFAVSVISSPNGSSLGLAAGGGWRGGGGGSACAGGIGWAGAGACASAGDARPNASTAATAMARNGTSSMSPWHCAADSARRRI